MEEKTQVPIKSNVILSAKVTEEIIRIELTEDDLAKRKTELANNLLKQGELDAALKQATADHKQANDPIKARNKELLTDIKLRFSDKRMLVHNVPDDERGIVEFYDEDGVRVGQRFMTREERSGALRATIIN